MPVNDRAKTNPFSLTLWRTIACLVASAALPVGCGGEDPAPAPVESVIQLVTPQGTVSGQVTDLLTGAPLADVEVTLLNWVGDAERDGAATVSSDADGLFRFDAVAASASIALRYRASGYADAFDTVTIQNAAGNLGVDNGFAFSGPIGLIPVNAATNPTATVRLTRVEDGATVADATVSAQLGVGYTVAGAPLGRIVATITDGGDGTFTLGGLPNLADLAAVLPDAPLRVAVTPSQESGLSASFFEGTVASVVSTNGVSLSLASAQEPLPPEPEPEPPFEPGDPIKVVGSNVGDLLDDVGLFPSNLGTGESVSIVFNRPLQEDALVASILDENGDEVPLEPLVLDPEGLSLRITPTGGFTAGRRYTVKFNVVARSTPVAPVVTVEPYQRAASFFTTTPNPLSFDTTVNARLLRGSNSASSLGCPNEDNNYLHIVLDSPVGARILSGGTPQAVQDQENGSVFLPAIATSADVGAIIDNPLNPASDSVVLAQIVEAPHPNGRTGFGRGLVIPWPNINQFMDGASNTFTLNIEVQFNYADTLEPALDGTTVARRPTGEAAGRLQAALTVEMGDGAPEFICTGQ